MNKEFENGTDGEELDTTPKDDRSVPEMPEMPEGAAGETETDENADTKALLDEILGEEAEDAAAGGDGEKSKKKRTRVDSRKLRYGSIASAVTAIVVVLVIVLNVVVGILADRFPVTLDLTKNKLFSLSENSVEIAKSIQKDVKVTVFYPEDNFKNTDKATASTQLSDMLREFYRAMQQYGSYSGGKVTVDYVDLNLNPDKASQYSQYDVAAMDILFTCGERYRKITINDLFASDQADYYSEPTYTSLVEQKMASNLKFVTNETRQVITVFTGHSEMEGATNALKAIYELNGYEIVELNLATTSEIDKDTVAGLIASPTKDYTKEEIERLQGWLNNDGRLGRNLMVYAHPTAKLPNLYEFLNVEYGIEVTDNMIVEKDTSRLLDVYTNLADLEDTDYSKGIAGTNKIVTGQTRQLLTHKENNTENSLYNIDIVTMPDTAELVKLADKAEETDTSKSVKAEEYPVIGMAAAAKWTYDNDAQETVKTNVMVSGSIFMAAYTSQANYNNEDLLLNAMNVMTGVGDNTVNVSTKSLEKDTVEFTLLTTNVLGYGVFTIGIPVIILVICLVVFLRRRHL